MSWNTRQGEPCPLCGAALERESAEYGTVGCSGEGCEYLEVWCHACDREVPLLDGSNRDRACRCIQSEETVT